MVAHVLHYAQIMGDKNNRNAELLLQVVEQVEHLRLHRLVQCGHRLVGQDDFRLHCQGPRHRHALPLPAAQAVGVFVEEGLLHSNRVQVAVCPPACLISGHLIGRQAEGDVLQYIHLGVQGGVGVLKDHLHILPKGLHILPRGMGHVVLLPAELHCAAVRPDAVKEQPRNRGFSAAGLTDDAQHLPLLQAEGNVIYC